MRGNQRVAGDEEQNRGAAKSAARWRRVTVVNRRERDVWFVGCYQLALPQDPYANLRCEPLLHTSSLSPFCISPSSISQLSNCNATALSILRYLPQKL